MDRLDIADRVLAALVTNLLSGRPYLVATDNSGTVARVHSLAAHLGATVTEQVSLGRRALRVDPAPRGGGAMMDAVLWLAVDVVALIGWARRRWR
jgi:hypothetical protein